MLQLPGKVGRGPYIHPFALKEHVRKELVKRCVNDLWYLMTEIGGLETVPHLITAKDGFKLSESFHKPHLDQWDRQRRAWRHGTGLDQLDLWPREFGKCLTPSSRLVMENGEMREAESVRIGDRIACVSDSLEPSMGVVVAKESNGIVPCVRLTFRSGRQVTVSANHPLRLWDRFERADLLRAGQHVAVTGLYVKPEHSISVEEARMIGYLTGDGSCRGAVRFTCATTAVLEKFERCASALAFGVHKLAGSKYDYSISGAMPFSRAYGLQGSLSIHKSIHPSVMRAERAASMAFLSAWYETDGTLEHGKHVAFGTSSKALAIDGMALLLRLGFAPRFDEKRVRYNDSTAYTLRLGGSADIARFIQEADPCVKRPGASGYTKTVADSMLRRIPREALSLLPVPVQARSLRSRGVRFGSHYDPSAIKAMRAADLTGCKALADVCRVQWDEVEHVDRVLDQPTIAIQTEPHGTMIVEGLACHNTTALLWNTIQDFLEDPKSTQVWWHAVEEKAEDACWWLSTQLQKNKKLRKLFEPGVLPSEKAKRFISGSEFTLPANAHGHAPSFRAYGWTSEATGAHAKIGKLDDIVARNIIEDNQQIKQGRWFQNTVCNVVEARGRKKAVGTRWAVDDQYSHWLKSQYWHCVTRAALENEHGTPDKKGDPTYMDMHLIKKKMDEMGMDFDPQMMNDPSPEGEKPWPANREHELFIKSDEAKGAGLIVVLSDPAPAKIGSATPNTRKPIYDGQKDYWANAVVKLRRKGQRNEVILLDGSVSRDWDDQQGFDEVCRLQRKWGTPRSVVEKVGSVAALYERSHRESARRSGVRYSPIELESVYRGKNHLFGALCARASADEFLICEETCDRQFLEMFMDQARNWRVLASGLNGLRFDDCANVVSFSCDPALAKVTPQIMDEQEWSPFKTNKTEEEYAYDSRHIRF